MRDLHAGPLRTCIHRYLEKKGPQIIPIILSLCRKFEAIGNGPGFEKRPNRKTAANIYTTRIRKLVRSPQNNGITYLRIWRGLCRHGLIIYMFYMFVHRGFGHCTRVADS